MFERMFSEYEEVVLNKNTIKWIKGLSTIKKASFFLCYIFLFIGALFSLFNKMIPSIIFYALMGICIIVFVVEDKRENDNGNDNAVNMCPRFINTIKILNKYGIDVTDENQLDKLIVKIEHEKSKHSYFNLLGNGIKWAGVYLFVPMYTLVINRLFEKSDFKECMKIIIFVVLLSMAAVLIGITFSQMIIEVTFPRNNDLDRFIRDVEDLKLFTKEAKAVKSSINLQYSREYSKKSGTPLETSYKKYEIEQNRENSYDVRTGFLLAFSGILFTKLFENVNIFQIYRKAKLCSRIFDRLSLCMATAAFICCVISIFTAVMTIYPFEYNKTKMEGKEIDITKKVKTLRDRNYKKIKFYKCSLTTFMLTVILMFGYKIVNNM